jgi:regulator of sigma E protease
MLSLVIFILVLSILIVVHEFGHFIAARQCKVKVEKFSIGFGRRLLSYKRKDTLYAVSSIPLGGYVKLAGDSLEDFKGKPYEYLAQPAFKRFKIIFFGPLLNYIMGFLLFWAIFFLGYPTLTNQVGGLIDGMGAQEAGILVGDKIVSIEGKKVDYWEDLQKNIKANKSKGKIKISVIRKAKEYTFEVRVKEKPLEDVLGQKRNVGLIGIKPNVEEIVKVRHGFFQSFMLGIKKTFELTVLTYKALWLMVSRKMSISDSVTGPLGMFVITAEAAKVGILALMHFMAVLSISLGIFNLLPLPALDGGHILLLGIEKIRGKYLSKKAEDIFSQVGLTFIIFLAVLVFLNDLVKFGFLDKVVGFFIK